MTPKPTPEQIQRACDLATCYNPVDYRSGTASAGAVALADTIAKVDAMQAERDKATADLGEIDRIAEEGVWGHPSAARNAQRVAAIAAPYRVETDPLVAEIGRLAAKHSVELSCEDVRSIASYFKPIGRSA